MTNYTLMNHLPMRKLSTGDDAREEDSHTGELHSGIIHAGLEGPYFMTLPLGMRQVFLPSKLTRGLERESCGMWISTSEASGTTRGLHYWSCETL